MQLDLINNTGVSIFGEQLEGQMNNSKQFDIASAFVTSESIRLIKIFLKKRKNKNVSCRLITGFYQNFNSKEVLEELRDMSNNSKNKFEVRVSANYKFHWKFYNFIHKNKIISYIGSANFTNSGLNNNGELLLKLSIQGNNNSNTYNLNKMFEREWGNSVPIENIPLDGYKQNKQSTTNSTKLDDKIKKVLNNSRKNQTRVTKRLSNKLKSARVVRLDDWLTTKTIKIVNSYSNWNKFMFYSVANKSNFERTINSKFIFLIEYFDRVYRFSIVNIRAHCILKTPEGKYFIAYWKVNRRRITEKRKKFLHDLGINYNSRNFTEMSLSTQKTQKLYEYFRNE